MRQALPTFIILLVCGLVLGGYFFGVKPQLDKQLKELRSQNETLDAQVDKLHAMQREIPELIKQLPEWKQQLALFRQAIPSTIDDQVFLSQLASQLKSKNVNFLSVDLSPGGPWLGNLNEDDREELSGIGVDVDAAMAVKTADYTIKLNGEFANVVQAFESLKSSRRLYTLDEFAGPAAGGAGSIVEMVDQANTPLMVTGRLYYGLPEGNLTDEQIDKVIAEILMTPIAMRLKRSVSEKAQDVTGNPGAPKNRGGRGGAKQDADSGDAPADTGGSNGSSST